MIDLGDRKAGETIDFVWSTNNRNGAAANRTTAGTLSVYKDNSAVQSTAGITDTAAFDGVTGLNHCRIDTSADTTFYASGHDYTVVLSGAVIDGQTVNCALATFSLKHRVGVLDQVTITPATSTVSVGEVASDDVVAYQHAALSLTFTIVDANSDPVDLSGKTLKFLLYRESDESIVYTLDDAEITIGGASNNQVTISGTSQYTGTARTLLYVLWNTTDDQLLAKGRLTIVEVPEPA